MFGNGKKVLVKPFKSPVSSKSDTLDAMWMTIKKAINRIFVRDKLSDVKDLSFEELYRFCYTMSLSKKEEFLYCGIRDEIRRHLRNEIPKFQGTSDEALLSTLVDMFNHTKLSVSMIRDVALYLEQAYIATQKKLGVFNLGLLAFYDVIIQNPVVKSRLSAILMSQVKKDRDGSVIDRDLMRKVLEMMYQISTFYDAGTRSAGCPQHLYRDEFERPFIEETVAYYEEESERYLTQQVELYSSASSSNSVSVAAVGSSSLGAAAGTGGRSALRSTPIGEFLKRAEYRIDEESRRVDKYVLRVSEEKLKKALTSVWIVAHAKTLLTMEEGGFLTLMKEHEVADLKRLYSLSQRANNVYELLSDHFFAYVKNSGVDILNSSSQQSGAGSAGSDGSGSVFGRCVTKLMDLKNRCNDVVVRCFRNDKTMHKLLKKAMDEVVNLDGRCTNYLAMYLDEILKGNGSAASSNAAAMPSSLAMSSDFLSSSKAPGQIQNVASLQLDDSGGDLIIEHVFSFFKHIHDKDVFENVYRGLLSKRLLGQRGNVSDEWEKSLLSKFKAECGFQFTAKMGGMFTDITMSKQVVDEFRRAFVLPSGGMGSDFIDIEANVLTGGYWPVNSTIPACTLPPKVQSTVQAFTKFYLEKHSGRRLTWFTHMGNADIKVTFKKGGPKEFNVSTYQMTILAQFNEKNPISLTELKTRCNIVDVAEFKRHLLSLCTPKARILLKSSKGKGVADDDVFSLNEAFESKHRKIKVPLISIKEIVGEGGSSSSAVAAAQGESSSGGADADTKDGIPAAVEESRRVSIEAATVRIMKARRRIQHNDLIPEVIRQLSGRFLCTPQAIKKGIESLIEREYMARDDTEHNTYTYVA